VFEHGRMEEPHWSPLDRRAPGTPFSVPRAGPWLFLRSGITFSGKRWQVAYSGSRANDRSWKEESTLFQRLRIIRTAEHRPLPTCRHSVRISQQPRKSPHRIREPMHDRLSTLSGERDSSGIRHIHWPACRDAGRTASAIKTTRPTQLKAKGMPNDGAKR
jgi:hypothetical protein